MAEFPIPETAQLRERIRDLEAEVERLRRRSSGEPTPNRDQQLIESEERFRVAFMTAPAALSIARTSDGRFIFVNPAFCKNSGYNEEEIIGHTFEDLGIYADEAQRERVFSELTAKGFIENEEFRYRNRAGELRVGLLSSRPITLSGEVCQLGLLLDTTQARAVEAERAKLQERLRQAQKMEAIGRLAGGVAHDFNNLLTAIMANVEMGLISLDRDEDVRGSLIEIRDAADRAARLTAQLLAYSRKLVLEPRPVNLSSQVGEMSTMLRRLIGADITLTFDLKSGLPPVLADPTQLEQVVLNLVVNARDSIRPNGSISVATNSVELPGRATERGESGRFIVLSVRDDGNGIPPEVLPHIFEPFFTTKAERGTGLGLSTVEGIVNQHRGFVEVDTGPGGTTFRVLWPEAPGDATVVRPSRDVQVTKQHQGIIVFAEDDSAVRGPMTRLLERAGFTVLAAANGAEALELLRNHRDNADILVADTVMPGMSGRALAEACRALLPTIAVVQISGYPQDDIDRGGVLHPGVVFLRKPFGAEQLTEAIDLARERAGEQVHETVR